MKVVKTFILWLLLSVIPLQGVAANVIMTCKAAHQSVSQQQDAEHTHRQHDGFDHAAADTGDKQDHFKSTDGSCTAWCGGAIWMHVDAITLPTLTAASDRTDYFTFHIPFVVPDRPEPRPRFLVI